MLNLIKEGGDERGKILFFTYGEIRLNLFEVKKGFARGGHYHDYPITHTLITGKIEHRQENTLTKEEEISVIAAPAILQIPEKVANLIIALEDSVFTEVFHTEYRSITYEKYRSIVFEKLDKKNHE